MVINEYVHLIRKDFSVTEDVKRYVNIYLITGENCYLIDSGVSGSEILISEYMNSIGRKLTDIKGVFLTHAHPDHIGAAAEIKRQTGCQIFAPDKGITWIEDIHKQFAERPIPNFFKLLSESVNVDYPLQDKEMIKLEENITIKALSTPGHSDDSMSYILNDNIVFTGDVIPAPNDLPIFVDYEECIRSIDKIRNITEIEFCCPAWDNVYNREELLEILMEGEEKLYKLRAVVHEVELELPKSCEAEKNEEICKRMNMQNFAGNPLFMKSIEACRER